MQMEEELIKELNYCYSNYGGYDEEYKEEYSDGYVLDCMLELLEELYPALYLLITNSDAEQVTDSEIIELIADYYKLGEQK